MVDAPTINVNKSQLQLTHSISREESIQCTNANAMKTMQLPKPAKDTDNDSNMTGSQCLKILTIKVEEICAIPDQALFQSGESSVMKMDISSAISGKPNTTDKSTTINVDTATHVESATNVTTLTVTSPCTGDVDKFVFSTANTVITTADAKTTITAPAAATITESGVNATSQIGPSNKITVANNMVDTTTSTCGATNTMDTSKVSFEGCAWEVECTETFLKELVAQPKMIKNLVISKIRRLAEGEQHFEFCKPLVGTNKLFELRLNESMRIIWEKTVTYSSRLSSKPSQSSSSKSMHCTTEVYSEVIRIWSLVLNHDRLDKCIKQINKSINKGLQSVMRKKLVRCKLPNNPGDHATREKIPQLYSASDEDQSDISHSFHPPASAKDNEYNVVTFYSFSDEFVESILMQRSRMDFPFKGWPKENEIINLDHSESILLLGRSGTGKTTCCLYRLWNQFKCYWEIATDPCLPRKVLIKLKPKSDTELENNTVDQFTSHNEVSNDADALYNLSNEDNTLVSSCDDDQVEGLNDEIPRTKFGETDEGDWEFHKEQSVADNVLEELSAGTNDILTSKSETTENNHLQQVFITKNYVLCAQFKKKFYDMAHTFDKVQGHLEFERRCLPYTLQELDSHAYPLFLTTYQWLQLLDASLGDNDPFFPRNPDGSLKVEILDMECSYDGGAEDISMMSELDNGDIKMHDGEQVESTAPECEPWQKVDANFFCDEMWPQVAKRICDSTQISPLLVWMEIKSFIKGSSQALRTTNGYLSLEEYQNLGRKMAPNFADDSKKHLVYKLFENYDKIKRRNKYFDDCDVVFNLFQRLSRLDDVNWCIHQFYIDEVQDFTQAELTLLLHCCRWPNSLFLTGDTAQSIMRGVSFRFSDLCSVFHYISKHMATSKGQKVKVKVPRIHTLTQNFRSHSGILQLAASVIDLLMNFFGSSLDKLPSDQGMFPGPKPVLLLSCSYSDLSLLLTGNEREASAIEFGAKQAIIVQSENVKNKLRKELDAIVLTVFESKGLEFDDVLLYDFFSESKVCLCVCSACIGMITYIFSTNTWSYKVRVMEDFTCPLKMP